MENEPKYEAIRQFVSSDDLLHALEKGSYTDKKHAILNIAHSDSEGEAALDIFLVFIRDLEMRGDAYLAIDMFMETCRSYPLMKILPILIAGVDDEDEFVSSHSVSALQNMVSPVKGAAEELSFDSFRFNFDVTLLSEHLRSSDPQMVIIGLLYIYHHPHNNHELFDIVSEQLKKKNKAITCIVRSILDTKLWRVIKLMNEFEDISNECYNAANALGMDYESKWIYDRYDEMEYLAAEQMKKLKP